MNLAMGVISVAVFAMTVVRVRVGVPEARRMPAVVKA